MSPGLPRSECDGQLAVFDAMVFFAICLLTCSILLENCRYTERTENEDLLASDKAGRLLEVLLTSSIGCRIDLGAVSLSITGHESLSDIIAAIVELVLDDVDLGPYTPMVDACESVLQRVCPDYWSPKLSAYELESGRMMLLFSMGVERSDREPVISASQRLATRESTSVLLVLTLAPALPAHVRSV